MIPPIVISTTELSLANSVAHNEWELPPLYDLCGEEFHVGDVVFFEYNTYYATLPRKGRITKIDPIKQRIKVISNKSGGYDDDEESPGVPRRMGNYLFGRQNSYWREFWIDMNACPQVIGDKNDKLCDC